MPRFGRMAVVPALLIAASIVAGCEGEPTTSNTKVGTLELVSGDDQSGSAGLLLGQHLVVRILDQYGRPAAGEPVFFELDAASLAKGASVDPVVDTTGADGIASTQLRLGASTGTYRLEAIWPGLELFEQGQTLRPFQTVEFVATAGPAPPATLTILSGDDQTGAVDSLLPQALTVEVTDAFGNPVPGVTVTFAVASGGGQVSTTAATTNSSGVATTSWTLGPSVGAQSVVAFVAGLQPVTFDATAQ